MNLYLAASWSRKEEIRRIAAELHALPGVDVQSRWLVEPVAEEWTPEFLQHRALDDRNDVFGCDVLIRFTDDLSGETVPSNLATGARMFEMGMAYAIGKTIIVVGGHQPIFDYLPSIIHVKDVKELKEFLLFRVADSITEVIRG